MRCNASPILTSLEAVAAQTQDATLLGTHVVQAVQDAMPQASWVGIYWLEDNELVLGPYVGPETEHTRIPVGVGVCGTAIRDEADQLIEDVRDIDNYLSCAANVRSELVLLIRSYGEIVGQIDLDAETVAAFDAHDACVLRSVADCLGGLLDMGATKAARIPDHEHP